MYELAKFVSVLKTGKQVFLRMIEKITELTLQRNGFYLIQIWEDN